MDKFSVQQEGFRGCSEERNSLKKTFWRGDGLMRPISIVVLMMGIFILGISSCATSPTKPLAPGELRLLSITVPDKEKIEVNSPFVVAISFEADGEPEIKTACFFFAGDGPHCFNVTDVNCGSRGTIHVKIYTNNPGSRLLEGYVQYIRDGKIRPTNVVSTYFRPVPK